MSLGNPDLKLKSKTPETITIQAISDFEFLLFCIRLYNLLKFRMNNLIIQVLDCFFNYFWKRWGYMIMKL